MLWRLAQGSQIIAPIPLARLAKNAHKGLVGKLGAKYVEGGFDARLGQSFRQSGSKRFGYFAPASQRLRQHPDETRILTRRLNLKAHDAARRGATSARAGCLALRFAAYGICSSLLEAALEVLPRKSCDPNRNPFRSRAQLEARYRIGYTAQRGPARRGTHPPERPCRTVMKLQLSLAITSNPRTWSFAAPTGSARLGSC